MPSKVKKAKGIGPFYSPQDTPQARIDLLVSQLAEAKKQILWMEHGLKLIHSKAVECQTLGIQDSLGFHAGPWGPGNFICVSCCAERALDLKAMQEYM